MNNIPCFTESNVDSDIGLYLSTKRFLALFCHGGQKDICLGIKCQWLCFEFRIFVTESHASGRITYFDKSIFVIFVMQFRSYKAHF